ncbi:nuclear factor interleukin-3-regulated protein-like [Anguilla rostrata]|uniref:nuclear factor interleukin-3-regulated protein-like n=1 Tax=Anguilla rostrata TaxID=7938 RepID=UPI0030D2CF7A
MQSIKKEPPSDTSCSGEGILVLAGALQGPDVEAIDRKLSNAAFGGKNSSSRRKREFIPDDSKDEQYWERRRKNNEAAKRSREKRRINDMVLENKMVALGEENASLKAELLSLKLRFGLVGSAAYAQEARTVSVVSMALRQDLAPAGGEQVSLFGDADPARAGGSCISVIRHSPLGARSPASEATVAVRGGARGPAEAVKQELTETGRYPREPREGGSPYELYPNCMATPFSSGSSEPSPLLPLARSSSSSPGVTDGDEGAASKSSDREDEQRVPKGPLSFPADPKSVITSCAKVPDVSSSALPHKLRIKAKPVRVKMEAVDLDYDAQGKPLGNVTGKGSRQVAQRSESELTQSPLSPLSLQVADLQDWTHGPEHWHAGRLETLAGGYKNGPSPTGHLTDRRVVDLKEGSPTDTESENAYLKRGISQLSREVASLKRHITNRQVSVVESGQSASEHALLSKGCCAE